MSRCQSRQPWQWLVITVGWCVHCGAVVRHSKEHATTALSQSFIATKAIGIPKKAQAAARSKIESAVDSTPHARIPLGPPTQAIELKLDRKHGPHTTSPRGLLLCLLAPGLPTAHGPPCPFKMMPSRIFSSPQGRRSGRRGPAAATQVTGQQPLAVRPRPKSERRSESDTT